MLRIILVVLFVLISLPTNYTHSAFAQGQEGKENNEWNPVSAGPATTWTAPLCGKGKFVIQPFSFITVLEARLIPKDIIILCLRQTRNININNNYFCNMDLQTG